MGKRRNCSQRYIEILWERGEIARRDILKFCGKEEILWERGEIARRDILKFCGKEEKLLVEIY